ncbi:MAG: hypothetical protein MZU97_25275 [Bacillus subtilis]|nr:hypothetical protein [Bacillus subtilis]
MKAKVAAEVKRQNEQFWWFVAFVVNTVVVLGVLAFVALPPNLSSLARRVFTAIERDVHVFSRQSPKRREVRCVYPIRSMPSSLPRSRRILVAATEIRRRGRHPRIGLPRRSPSRRKPRSRPDRKTRFVDAMFRLEWHFIGRLQTNKVKAMINRIACLHSLDSLRLAARQSKNRRNTTLPCFVEVHISDEATKTGVSIGRSRGIRYQSPNL